MTMGSETAKPKKYKVVLSDLHLGAGVFYPNGEKNPKESFYFDRELIELINFFCEERYQNAEVELILNGDILDFLSVHYKNKFLPFISEKLALYKLKTIIKGHEKVFTALQRFIAAPNKSITYVLGNHDADFFFPSLQEHFIKVVGQHKHNEAIKFITQEHYDIEGKIQIHHGNQFETMHSFDYKNPFIVDHKQRKFLSLPWGSLYVMNVVNKFKNQRDYLDKVAPIYLLFIYALITEPLFIMKFISYTAYYYLKTRFIYFPLKNKRQEYRNWFKNLGKEFFLLDDGEHAGRAILDTRPDLYAMIMGHTHKAKQVNYPNHQVYLNTGTWIKMIHFDLDNFGKTIKLTFCLIEYEDNDAGEGGVPKISLFEWKGIQSPFRYFLT